LGRTAGLVHSSSNIKSTLGARGLRFFAFTLKGAQVAGSPAIKQKVLRPANSAIVSPMLGNTGVPKAS
jgi:hypothetical protein